MNRFIIPLAVLAACDDGTTTDTADTSDSETDCSFDGNTTVDTVDVQCDDVADNAEITAVLTGLAAPGSVKAFIQETGNQEPQWSEEHTLDEQVSFDDQCLTTETVRVTIEDLLVAVGENADGVASVFGCADHLSDENVVTYAVYAEDVDDSSITSCLAFGHDPAGLINGDYENAGAAVDPSFPLAGCEIGVRR
jgi:hypothetical protein